MRKFAALIAVVGMLALAGCGDDKKSTSTPSASSTVPTTEISMRAGLNDPSDVTVAVLAYLPSAITVSQGTTVSWTMAGPEPHSVTFLPPGQTMPSPESPEGSKLFAPTPPTGSYDGKTLVNSGLIPLGPQAAAPFKVKFDTPGLYKFACVIHPLMVGTVTVAATGAKADTQAEVQARGDSEMNQWLTEGRAAKKAMTDKAPVKTANADGTTTWTIEMGSGTAHTDILAFAPVPVAIKAQDKVVFVNNSSAPHTASFAGKQSLPQNPTDPAVDAAKPGPSPQTLNATDFINTGLLPPNAPPGGAPPLAVRSFTFTVPAAGQYAYVCLLHVTSGMAGVINVA
jgi:plastocyanin